MPPLNQNREEGDWYTHLHYLSKQMDELEQGLSSFKQEQREREDRLSEKIVSLQSRAAILGFIAGAAPVIIALLALILRWRG